MDSKNLNSALPMPPPAKTGLGVFEVRPAINRLEGGLLERTIAAMKGLGVVTPEDQRFLIELEMEREKRRKTGH
jgi:hypothetical protein